MTEPTKPSCNCVAIINEKLVEAGENTRIRVPCFVSRKTTGLIIETEKINPSSRKKAVSIYTTFCPFCGVKHT